MVTRTLFLLLAMGSATASVLGQTRKEAETALRQHLAGIAELRVAADERLTVTLLENGEPYRRDHISMYELDTAATTFSQEEGLLILRCKEKAGRCIDKETIRNKAISPTGRCAIPVPADDPQGVRTRQLINAYVGVAKPTVHTRTKRATR